MRSASCSRRALAAGRRDPWSTRSNAEDAFEVSEDVEDSEDVGGVDDCAVAVARGDTSR